jgi:hypothetical protein
MASTVRGCSASTALPSDPGPKPLGPSNARPQFRPWAPLATRRPLPNEALPQDHGWWPSPGGALCLGRSLLCGPVGLAHSLDRASRRLTRLALGLEIAPQLLGTLQECVRKDGVASVATCSTPDSLSSTRGPVSSSTPSVSTAASTSSSKSADFMPSRCVRAASTSQVDAAPSRSGSTD